MVTDRRLHRRRILVVEDEYLLADELASELAEQGAIVLGPVSNVRHALALLEREERPDGAILDVNLGGESVFPLADALLDGGVPMVFATGYDPSVFPDRFADVSKCEKPINIRRIAAVLSDAIGA